MHNSLVLTKLSNAPPPGKPLQANAHNSGDQEPVKGPSHPGGMGKEMGGLRIACKSEKHFSIHVPS